MESPQDIDPRNAARQNRAIVYDPKRELVLLVLGTGGDQGQASVCALRYRHVGSGKGRCWELSTATDTPGNTRLPRWLPYPDC